MPNPEPTGKGESPLRDPEVVAAPKDAKGVSRRKFLGVPAWAAAVAFAALAALMYLFMLTLM